MSDFVVTLILFLFSILVLGIAALAFYFLQTKRKETVDEFKLKEYEIDKKVDASTLRDLVDQANKSSGSDTTKK